MPERLPASPAPPVALERRHWLAAVAMLVVLFTPYQTLVQTVTTDDAVRKGIEADDYQMTWVQVGYGVGVLYGLFTALWLSARIGARCRFRQGMRFLSPMTNGVQAQFRGAPHKCHA
jgi:hypothetical protein